MLYRFVGRSSEIGETQYRHVGEQGEFTDEFYTQVLLGGAPFITEEEFTVIGFTLDDLSRLRQNPDLESEPELSEKIRRARKKFTESRALAQAGLPL